MIIYPLKKIKAVSLLAICFFIPLNPIIAFESRDYLVIDMLVKSCFKDSKSCNLALSRIHDYQKDSARNKKFSCQTRLLGLESNIIKAMNFNLKKKEYKSIIKAVKKYC